MRHESLHAKSKLVFDSDLAVLHQADKWSCLQTLISRTYRKLLSSLTLISQRAMCLQTLLSTKGNADHSYQVQL